MIYDGGHLYCIEGAYIDEVLDASHGAVVSAFEPTQFVMCIAQAVDGDRNRAHAHLGKAMCHFWSDERGIARHAPPKALVVRISHDVEEVAVKQRLAACDAQLHTRDVEICFHLVDDREPFLAGKVVGVFKARCAGASAVKASFVALQCELEEQFAQFRGAVQRSRVI